MSTERSGPIVITATAPTPNGALHVGHLSGPYIAADVAVRAERASGREVISVGGIDPHQNYVVAKAELEGRPTLATLDDYSARVRAIFDRARISYDLFVEPQHDRDYRDAVAALVRELVERGAAEEREIALLRCDACDRTLHHAYVSGTCPTCGAGAGGGTCEPCGSFVTAGTLVDAVCSGCGEPGREVIARVPVLALEQYRERLLETWTRASLAPRIRALVGHYLTDGLPEIVLAYPTDWGIPLRDDDDVRVDVWVEMGVGYLYAIARELDPSTTATAASCTAAWERLGAFWNFLGIDNAFYFAVMFPALFMAFGMEDVPFGGIVVNEFYTLDGAKFSTSRRHAIWADEFLAEEDPEWVRLYLSWDRPDRYQSDFTLERYRTFRDGVAELLDGERGAPLPDGLADQELERAHDALRVAGFDAALAARCALSAVSADPVRARALLGMLAAGDLRVPAAGRT
ncbi:MAG TPA: class I tRNA ligase family protein [Solirubrobacteraceae bacterium]